MEGSSLITSTRSDSRNGPASRGGTDWQPASKLTVRSPAMKWQRMSGEHARPGIISNYFPKPALLRRHGFCLSSRLMSSVPPPDDNPHNLPPKTIALIVAVAAVGVVVGSIVVMKKEQPGQLRKQSGIVN